jgi:hypothetical protein
MVLASDSLIGRSLMEANFRCMRPLSSNSGFRCAYERNQLPESSCHSYANDTPSPSRTTRRNCRAEWPVSKPDAEELRMRRALTILRGGILVAVHDGAAVPVRQRARRRIQCTRAP